MVTLNCKQVWEHKYLNSSFGASTIAEDKKDCKWLWNSQCIAFTTTHGIKMSQAKQGLSVLKFKTMMQSDNSFKMPKLSRTSKLQRQTLPVLITHRFACA